MEKGCKKTSYCEQEEASNSEWKRPWNFCCDKARCNAKQGTSALQRRDMSIQCMIVQLVWYFVVKDKPQRIYGMKCRRTDDCVQGHVTRSVCPDLYKTCPRIPRVCHKPTLRYIELIIMGLIVLISDDY